MASGMQTVTDRQTDRDPPHGKPGRQIIEGEWHGPKYKRQEVLAVQAQRETAVSVHSRAWLAPCGKEGAPGSPVLTASYFGEKPVVRTLRTVCVIFRLKGFKNPHSTDSHGENTGPPPELSFFPALLRTSPSGARTAPTPPRVGHIPCSPRAGLRLGPLDAGKRLWVHFNNHCIYFHGK